MNYIKLIPIALILMTGLFAVAEDGDINRQKLAWEAVPDVAEYRLYFSQNTNNWTHVKVVPATGPTEAVVDLPTVGQWWFIATARNADGIESLPSNMVTVTIQDGRPIAPTLRSVATIVTRVSTVTTSTNLIFVP